MHAGLYLSLGSTNITTNNTEILITSIGDDAEGGLPSLTCHTDLTQCCRSVVDNNGDLGQWTQPNGSVVLNNTMSQANGYTLYIVRNASQVIKLARRRNLTTTFKFPFSQTGSYCCTIPTIQQDMSLCANLGEWFCNIHTEFIHNPLPVVCPSLSPLNNGNISYDDPTLGLYTAATYTCGTGYTLDGDTTRICGSDGVWSGKAPTCEG